MLPAHLLEGALRDHLTRLTQRHELSGQVMLGSRVILGVKGYQLLRLVNSSLLALLDQLGHDDDDTSQHGVHSGHGLSKIFVLRKTVGHGSLYR